jgi:LacI family transcriptional regulator
LAVPTDLSVAGFDDSERALTVWPQLTTIRQPVADMAEAALQNLLSIVQRRRPASQKVGHIFGYELIVRDSCAARIAKTRQRASVLTSIDLGREQHPSGTAAMLTKKHAVG